MSSSMEVDFRRGSLSSTPSSTGRRMTKFMINAGKRRMSSYVANKLKEALPEFKVSKKKIEKTPRGKGTIKKETVVYPVSGSFKGNFQQRTRYARKPRIEKRGFGMSVEFSKVVSDQQALYVGHTTHPTRYLRRVFLGALVKQLFAKAGIYVKDMNDTIIQIGGDNNDSIEVLIYGVQGDVKPAATGGSAGLVASATYTNGATPWMFVENLDTGLINWFNGYQNAAVTQNNFVLTQATVKVTPRGLPGAYLRTGSIMLEDSYVEVNVSSYLAIQNRSTSAAGSAYTDTVDTTPLQGKMYSGLGNGCKLVRNQRSTLTNAQGVTTGDDKFGLIGFFPNGMTISSDATSPVTNESVTFTSYSTPPPAWAFKGVRRVSGKLVLQPGQIKTSYVKSNKRMTVQALMKQLYVSVFVNAAVLPTAGNDLYNNQFGNTVSTLSKTVRQQDLVHRTFGEFKLFGFEKVIDIAEVAQQSIQLGVECNLTMGMYIIQNINTYTVRRFEETDVQQ